MLMMMQHPVAATFSFFWYPKKTSPVVPFDADDVVEDDRHQNEDYDGSVFSFHLLLLSSSFFFLRLIWYLMLCPELS